MEKEKKLQIIKAADKRFSRHGLSKTTLEEIARDLRIGKATIYHYFESKDKLFYETLGWEAAQYLQNIKNIFDNIELNRKEKFLRYFEYKAEIILKYKLLYEALLLFLSDKSLENEIEFIKALISSEEEILKPILAKIIPHKTGLTNSSIPSFVVTHSWGYLFAKKITVLKYHEGLPNSDEIFIWILEKLSD